MYRLFPSIELTWCVAYDRRHLMYDTWHQLSRPHTYLIEFQVLAFFKEISNSNELSVAAYASTLCIYHISKSHAWSMWFARATWGGRMWSCSLWIFTADVQRMFVMRNTWLGMKAFKVCLGVFHELRRTCSNASLWFSYSAHKCWRRRRNYCLDTVPGRKRIVWKLENI